jgi:hypothetical protein
MIKKLQEIAKYGALTIYLTESGEYAAEFESPGSFIRLQTDSLGDSIKSIKIAVDKYVRPSRPCRSPHNTDSPPDRYGAR